jgi:hypothetical protein
MNHIQQGKINNNERFLFTSESVGEGHPGIFKINKESYFF